jgi:hypothetical protein
MERSYSRQDHDVRGRKVLYTDAIFLNPRYLSRHLPEERNLNVQLALTGVYELYPSGFLKQLYFSYLH